MLNQSAFTLINPQNGNLAFKLFHFTDNSHFDHIQRNNYFSLIWIKQGSGTITADFTEHIFEANSLFAFAPYQPYMFNTKVSLSGIAILFHPEFFCIFKHHKEVSANGVLFNNIYNPPFVHIDEHTTATLEMICGQIETEMQNTELAQHELLVSYLKIFLITAARLKAQQQPDSHIAINDQKEPPFILQRLKDAIEQNFKTKHSPAEYAEMLYITPKALAKITKRHFNKTLSSLINERIIIEAKRELYLSDKTVKEIAYELGYEDEYYFSRFFKVNADVSPQLYRETVGYAKSIN
ncbi:AraC family transcriptional regulator [Niastella koreensis]|uniref:Transcriptional regulator, AraC family n=2 Tax=Niastella koreensis TaxID=354356 RepID=G8TFU3_NIAKG|nr:helix-turn-helix domain-containing protein [Niastella koreensis]AEW00542.1 transcriptional regulator, AraC family [Niastella koreensis GR20-10]OQP52399.1 AraC family transcriptional regulator [Niastella koreensis]